jgi:hypothetical protein
VNKEKINKASDKCVISVIKQIFCTHLKCVGVAWIGVCTKHLVERMDEKRLTKEIYEADPNKLGKN